MAGAYGADPALPGAFTEPAAEHGGRPVLMALGYSYFLSGHGPRDIPEAIEDSGACEGTGRLGPPLMIDDLSQTASVTARELGGQDEDVTPWPDDGERSPAEEGIKRSNTLTDAAAEHARLLAEIAQARARYQDLQANRPDPGDIKACRAHRALEGAASEAVFDADDAASAYLSEHPDVMPVYGAARRWHDLGVCTVPVKNDGSKRPIGEWKEYQERLPTSDELFGWHHRGRSGLGIVTGRTGREDGLAIEMFELEARAVSEGILDKFTDALKEAGLWEVWLRITAGFWDVSPSGGFHAYWYCEDVTGNVKLAQREATPEELVIKPGDKYRTLIETRGRGGFTVIAPTPGSYHETGRAWEAQGGPPEALAIITAEQREGIFTCARKFHTAGPIHSRKERAKYEKAATPAKGKTRTKTAAKTAGEASTRPGDLYNESGPDWAELLEPDGWTLFQRDSDGTEHWTRPGKDRGTSATTGNPQHETDKLHVFTSSTAFEPGEAYTKFAYYAITKFEGDFAAAAAQLRKDGYAPASEAAKPSALKPPAVYPAILAFEQLYDLRPAADGFYARPRDPDTPAVVIEIGDDLEYTVMRWWRAQAEAWNAEVNRGAIEATDAWKAELEAKPAEEQLELLREMVYAERKKKDEGETVSGADPVPKVDTFSRIMKHLRASATQHEPVELHLRVVDGPGYVAVDLADQSGSVVLITADGWKITDVRSVPDAPWFRRSGTMLPQVHPVAPENVPATLDSARQVLGLDAGQWAIALCGLIGAYFPSIARPGWWLSGPSGVGKTTRGEQLAGWIDPVATLGGRINLKRDPRDARAKAMNTFVFTIDNASTISQDESDFWCTMHTGASDQVPQAAFGQHAAELLLPADRHGDVADLARWFPGRRPAAAAARQAGRHRRSPRRRDDQGEVRPDQAAGDGRHLHRDRRGPEAPAQGAGGNPDRRAGDERLRPAAEGGRPGLPEAGARHRAGRPGSGAV